MGYNVFAFWVVWPPLHDSHSSSLIKAADMWGTPDGMGCELPDGAGTIGAGTETWQIFVIE